MYIGVTILPVFVAVAGRGYYGDIQPLVIAVTSLNGKFFCIQLSGSLPIEPYGAFTGLALKTYPGERQGDADPVIRRLVSLKSMSVARR